MILALLTACAALSLASARGGERVPIQRPNEDNSITEASRQLDAVKAGAARQSEPVARGGLPGVVIPSLPESQPASIPRPATPEELAREKRSANWLVEAMMKSATETRKRDTRAEKHEPGTRQLEERGLAKERIADQAEADALGTRKEETIDLKAEAPGGALENPLAKYMAGWLSPQDYALLKSTLETSDSSRGSAGASAGVPASTLPAPGADAATVMPLSDRPDPIVSKRAENPYLRFFAPGDASPVSPAIQPSPAMVAPAPAAAVAPLLVPEPVPMPTSRRPETKRSPGDERYYKPLKRF